MPKSAPNHRAQAEAPAEDLGALLREAELALSGNGVETTDKVTELRARLRDAIAAGQARMQDVAAAARRQAARADEAIRENPYAAIGIAAGVALVAGYLLSRNAEDRH